MKPSVISLAALLFAAPLVHAADAPEGLTGWRTARGITLSWSQTPAGGFTIWRGTAPGQLRPLATLPPGQAGFWDTSAGRTQAYLYAVGDARSHGPELELPGAPPPVRILSGLVTTCSGLVPGGVYPADTQNFFYPSRHQHVQYFGYFFMKPFDPTVREARIVWRDPKGEVFSEYSHSITPKRVDLPGGAVGQLVLAQAIGLRAAVAQNGQQRVPTDPGMYTIEAFVDEVPVALTVFSIREEAPKKASPAGPPVPGGTSGPGGASVPGGTAAPGTGTLPALPGGVPRTTLPGAGIP